VGTRNRAAVTKFHKLYYSSQNINTKEASSEDMILGKLVDREKDNININLRETAHKDVNYRIQYTGR
jgi:hypothetical protein